MKISSFVDMSKALISNDDKEANIKHFIIFMTFIHYALASFMILFGIVRATVDKDMMKQILDNDYYIILVGVGVLTLENIGQALSSRANVLSSLFSKKTTTDDSGAVISVEENKQTTTAKVPDAKGDTVIKAETVNTDNIETVNTGIVNGPKMGTD